MFILVDGCLLDASSYLVLVVADLVVDLLYAIVNIHCSLRVAETHLLLQVARVLILLFILPEVK